MGPTATFCCWLHRLDWMVVFLNVNDLSGAEGESEKQRPDERTCKEPASHRSFERALSRIFSWREKLVRSLVSNLSIEDGKFE